MGHSEMLLAVAGLKPDEVKSLTKKLATGDWSDFPPAQRTAYSLAYKLTKDPSAVTDADRAALVAVFGRELEQAERITWNTVSTGYQPEMTRAWFACLNAFYEESKPDRVFTNSVFWVVTRTNDCFY